MIAQEYDRVVTIEGSGRYQSQVYRGRVCEHVDPLYVRVEHPISGHVPPYALARLQPLYGPLRSDGRFTRDM